MWQAGTDDAAAAVHGVADDDAKGKSMLGRLDMNPDHLYVVDTSVFASIGAVNPALTAMANSLRVGDHLLERLS